MSPALARCKKPDILLIMMIRSILITSAVLCAASHAGVRSGKATADLLTASITYQPGKPVQTGVRLKIDRAWHTYWINPGEGGMKLSVKWTLPPGWTADEPSHPVPKSFHTGGLAGYGYEGIVIFPVTLNPPADATGEVRPEAKVSWLTCNDDACVPGNAALSVTLTPGASPTPAPDAPAIDAALKTIPRPLPGLTLAVAEEAKDLILTLKAPAEEGFDLASAKVFPQTPQAIDPSAEIKFIRSGDTWTSTVPKNEYASAPLKSLTLVIAGAGVPAAVTWSAESP